MRVLIVTPAYPNRNSAVEGLFNEQHALALAAQGITVDVVLCKPWLPEVLASRSKTHAHLVALPDLEVRRGVRVACARYIHVPHYGVPDLTAWSCAQSIAGTIRKIPELMPCDVVRVHSAWPCALAISRLREELRCPYVVTLHIQDDERLCGSRRGGRLYREMLNRAGAVVTVGSPLERVLSRYWRPRESGRQIRIPNGVDRSAVAEALASAATPARGSIVSVSSLWPSKGIDLNLKALAALDADGIAWAEYVVVGDGPERSRLEALSRQLGIARKVRFTGRLPHLAAVRQIAESEIFSLPSWQESFGVVYVEALACGVPAIGCLGQGAEDIVRDGRDGLLVTPHDLDDLTRALRRLLLDKLQVNAMGTSGRDRAEQFSWNTSATAYANLYDEVLRQQEHAAA